MSVCDFLSERGRGGWWSAAATTTTYYCLILSLCVRYEKRLVIISREAVIAVSISICAQREAILLYHQQTFRQYAYIK